MSEIAVPCVIYGAKSSEDRHGSIGTQLEDSRQTAERPAAARWLARKPHLVGGRSRRIASS